MTVVPAPIFQLRKDVFILTPCMQNEHLGGFPSWRCIRRKWKKIYHLCLLFLLQNLWQLCRSLLVVFLEMLVHQGSGGDWQHTACARRSFVAFASTPALGSCDPAQLKRGFWGNDPWFPPTTGAMMWKTVLPVYCSGPKRQLWISEKLKMSLRHTVWKAWSSGSKPFTTT